MSDRRFLLNRKCWAVLQAIDEIGPKAHPSEARWRYVLVSSKGVIATDTVSLIRVTLPYTATPIPEQPAIFDYDTMESLRPKDTDNPLNPLGDFVVMPEGEEAKTSGKYIVPNHEASIPTPKSQIAVITVNAARLIRLLQAAMDVTEHSRNLVRLRLYKDCIRIDSHRDHGGQEFLGLLMGTSYNGNCIPGDVLAGAPAYTSEMVTEKSLKLPLTEGRKFRDVL
jgi:hypothetical protein